ncbi:MAG: TolC family protein [Deltaproteobacteria bacterium]|nr:TolC family protein [Deltaproteobacteria bacterium]
MSGLMLWVGLLQAASAGELWWEDWGDPGISAVVDGLIAESPDVQVAQARVRQVRAAARASGARLGPQLSWDTSASAGPMSSLGFNFGMPSAAASEDQPTAYWTGSSALTAKMSVDLWGAGTLGWAAARDDLAASEADLRATSATLLAAAVGAYLDLVAATEQRAFLEEQIQAGEELLLLVQRRYDGAQASSLDVLQQRQSLASSRAALPTLRLAERQARLNLGALLGRAPDAELPSPAQTLPELPSWDPAQEEQDLLRSRPDLRAARERAEAAHRRRLQAERNFLPTLAISGSAGWQYSDMGELRSQDTWSAGGAFSVPLMQMGAIHAQRSQAMALETAAEEQLRKATLEAEAGLASARSREALLGERAEAVALQREAARLAYDQSLELYLAGLARYSEVLMARNAWQAAELSLVSARRDRLSARIALHAAVGGTWTEALVSRGSSR